VIKSQSIPVDSEMAASLRVTLLDTSATLVEEWKNAFAEHVPLGIRGRISFVQSSLEDLPTDSYFDCIVSPSNSYGHLDGGLVTSHLSSLYIYTQFGQV
jgi:hypothetical protein